MTKYKISLNRLKAYGVGSLAPVAPIKQRTAVPRAGVWSWGSKNLPALSALSQISPLSDR